MLAFLSIKLLHICHLNILLFLHFLFHFIICMLGSYYLIIFRVFGKHMHEYAQESKLLLMVYRAPLVWLSLLLQVPAPYTELLEE